MKYEEFRVVCDQSPNRDRFKADHSQPIYCSLEIAKGIADFEFSQSFGHDGSVSYSVLQYCGDLVWETVYTTDTTPV
jgi:hypothetical protein